ncbi:DMT family transporter, partial [Ralstonia pseudosolanacearum]
MTSIASPAQAATHDASQWTSALYILVGASVWGISWYPYRLLAGWGLGSLLASAMTGAAATIVAAVALRRHFHTFRWSWLIPAGSVWKCVGAGKNRISSVARPDSGP